MSKAEQEDDGSRLGSMAPAAILLLIAVSGVALWLLAKRNSESAGENVAGQAVKSGGSVARRGLLGMLIAALENDIGRRAVIAALKIARSRM